MQQLGDVTAVTFNSSEGNTLIGTLHVPAQARADLPVIVLLSPGVKMRVGPGRLYVPLTQTLVEMGYRVFRFDFFGLGDSSGEVKVSDVKGEVHLP